MTVWTSALWKMNIQLAKIWPEMVKILKYLIVIWIESEYMYEYLEFFNSVGQFERQLIRECVKN